MTCIKISEANQKVCEVFTVLSTIIVQLQAATGPLASNTSDEIVTRFKSNIFVLKRLQSSGTLRL